MSASRRKWSEERPHALVIACSDGRLQEQTDEFLRDRLGLAGFDRFYVPGGGGALASSGRDFIRAQQLRKECAYLIELHDISRVILLFHGPSEKGPANAVCADYRRKLSWASPAIIRDRQRIDALELIEISATWAHQAEVSAYRCEVSESREVEFVALSN